MVLSCIVTLAHHRELSLAGVQCLSERACDVRCSRALAPVCALVTVGSAHDLRLYHNACHLNKIRCLLNNDIADYNVAVQLLPDSTCGIVERPKKVMNGRRVTDFTIYGARAFCNHSCPTHCTDIYDPVCTMFIDQNDDVNRKRRKIVMINHCHADLISCALQQTVMIKTITDCWGAMAGFAYSQIAQAAVLKKMGLIAV